MTSAPQLNDGSVEIYIESKSVGSLISRLLARITDGEVLTRYFRGPVWEAIKSCRDSKPTEVINVEDKGETQQIALTRYLAMFLINSVCATIAREVKLGLKVSPPDGDFVYLGGEEKEQMKATIGSLVEFVQTQLCVEVEINPETEIFFIK